ncbi:helix-turn-helix domain-containing protein [Actinomadura rudentiformis]|uniref:helix-turn-helix domain-containing protein n=1 Tax=Actinomadura rudentiformis TaxID=359158 RepID=UPI001CEF8C0A|nr:AraC family transcriptional regulator [Actinomadura rudentiformis]
MRTAQVVAESPHFVIHTVECADDHAWWSEPELSVAAQIILVRRGRFRVSSRGREVMVDPTVGYLHGAGEEERFSHPAGGDSCTSVTFTAGALIDELWPEPAGGSRSAVSPAVSPAVRVDPRLEFAHRMLPRSLDDPAFGGAEAVLDLLTLALRGSRGASPGHAPGRAGLAERAREAIAAAEREAADLVGLARLLETSPSHLSRTFRHHVGMTVSRYRNRVRVSRALAAIEAGETDLAALALALGFSDQAHFSRVMRDELGHTPGRVRALLAA